jgi:hypothetical protein
MHVKITSNYTREEVLEILAQWVRNGLLTTQELAEAEERSFKQDIRFFDLNDLLQPFTDKFVGFSKEEQSLAYLTGGVAVFYRSLTLRLFQGCPLHQHTPTCIIASTHGELLLQVGHLSNKVSLSSFSAFKEQVLSCLNEFLRQYAVDAAYHEIVYEDRTVFLLLSGAQYDCLLTNRLLEFARVEYPEVEAWRRAIRLEDLPF